MAKARAKQNDAPDAHVPEKRGRGRPPVSHDARQVTLILTVPLDEALTDLTHAIWLNSRSRITKSEIVRATLKAVLESGVELASASSEQEIGSLLRRRLR